MVLYFWTKAEQWCTTFQRGLNRCTQRAAEWFNQQHGKTVSPQYISEVVPKFRETGLVENETLHPLKSKLAQELNEADFDRRPSTTIKCMH